MRRILGYKSLMFAAAVAIMAGCSNSPSPDFADAGDAGEAQYDARLPDAAEAVESVTGEKAGQPARPAAVPPDGADSDGPRQARPPAARQATKSPPKQSKTPGQAGGVGEPTKTNGRRVDDDDPKAPLVAQAVVEQKDDTLLDNGRAPSATPIPEAQRVAVAPREVASEPIDDGRAPTAKPGNEVPRPEPATDKPGEPAAPTKTTLADVSESIQALDKDGDGQIGLYEWPRGKLAEFKTLDANKDGFLTAAELVTGRKKVADAEPPKTDPASKVDAAEDEKPDNKEKVNDKKKPDDTEKPAAKANDPTPPPENPKTPAAETTDKTKTPDAPADGAAAKEGAATKDGAGTADKPKPGS